MKTLVENQFGHGAKRGFFHRIKIKARRALRPSLAKSTTPFDWATGIDNSIGVTIKNQFQSDSCGGQAGSYWLGIVQAYLNKTPYVERSAKSVYSAIAYSGGGTTDGALQNRIETYGANLETDVPSYENGTTTETFMTDTSWENWTLTQKALIDSGWVMVSVPLDSDSIAQAIKNTGAVIFNIDGQNGNTPTWLSPTPQPPSKLNSEPIWGHFVCACIAKIYNSVNSIGITESWGTDVGLNGIQFFTDSYIQSGYLLDCFTFVKPQTPPQTQLFTTSQSNLELQQKLNMAVDLQTGYYGMLTLIAVVQFEIANKLGITSTISPTMWTLLNS